ncbi:MAG: phosphoribosylanthranilate isomerase [Saccharofermentanales bacterium]
MTKIKICGISTFRDIEYINEAFPDYAGFVFAESRRQVDFGRAFLLRCELRKGIRTVGVFVDEDIGLIRRCCDAGIIDMIQLHGDEDEKYIRTLRRTVSRPLIKAIRIGADFDPETLSPLLPGDGGLYEYPLFDTHSRQSYGGTGQTFDWSLIRDCERPFFLAGGLDALNVADAIRAVNPYCVDLSSGVESDGVKDRGKILEIVRIVRSALIPQPEGGYGTTRVLEE